MLPIHTTGNSWHLCLSALTTRSDGEASEASARDGGNVTPTVAKLVIEQILECSSVSNKPSAKRCVCSRPTFGGHFILRKEIPTRTLSSCATLLIFTSTGSFCLLPKSGSWCAQSGGVCTQFVDAFTQCVDVYAQCVDTYSQSVGTYNKKTYSQSVFGGGQEPECAVSCSGCA